MLVDVLGCVFRLALSGVVRRKKSGKSADRTVEKVGTIRSRRKAAQFVRRVAAADHKEGRMTDTS